MNELEPNTLVALGIYNLLKRLMERGATKAHRSSLSILTSRKMPRSIGAHNFDGPVMLGGSDPSRAEVPDSDYQEMPAFPLAHTESRLGLRRTTADVYGETQDAADLGRIDETSRKLIPNSLEGNERLNERYAGANRAVDSFAKSGHEPSQEYQRRRDANNARVAKNIMTNPASTNLAISAGTEVGKMMGKAYPKKKS